MKAYDFDAVVYGDEVYCLGCCPVDTDNQDVEPIFADSEWNYIPVCCRCGESIDYVIVLEAI